ncbi:MULTISPECIES: family 43 glycosylhydrolase [unclassified Massilia]|uniref:family 43 glycosylhydrolase n=1 Tax=unclassified Massilia TaxID=2609279 RepID=UPI001780D3A6|nr:MULTISPECIES: family 43 glycosylhydrolase [unclassified Massilia]MBD8531057.1 family 43 glycosylhydrolase [Massilia sp. CFBP 13647]MBD8674757.1 family 43 glycosylhydrolase [Massilia sp. CFBP 13721]
MIEHLRLAALALVLGAPMCFAQAPAEPTIRNGVFWKDTAGTPIYSQGGGMLKIGAKYYWYGVRYDEAVAYAKSPRAHAPHAHFSAVTAYSSTDLVNWTPEGDVLTPAGLGKLADPKAWLGRMGVVYNKLTRKYVLLIQYGGKAGAGLLFATSDAPTGPFVFARLQEKLENVASPTSGDQTVFTDDDGQPYLIFSNNGDRRSLYVAPLRGSDFLQVEAATNVHRAPGGGREGNAMFKRDGLYYFFSSDLHGWNASRSYYMTAPRITGPYTPEKLLPGTDADFSHVSQNGFFIPVQGKAGTTVLYAGDRWSNFAGNGHGYNIWTPLSFKGAEPSFNSLSEFTLDAGAGTWRVGKGNNYLLNPGFEADRVRQTGVAGWVSSWTSLGGDAPFVNTLDGRTGRWALTLRHPGKTMGSAVQNVTLPNGVYTLKVWARSSGGQGVARLYASGHGGPELVRSLDKPVGAWTEITLPGIRVETGSVQVGVYTEGKEGDWVSLDDFSLVRE